MVDRLARNRPKGVYGLWPTDPSSYDLGFRTIHYEQLANIINGLAWWIVEKLGPAKGDHRVLTQAAHKSLFEALECETLVTTDPTPPAAQAILEAVKPRRLIIPDIDELLEQTHLLFPYDKSFEEARWDPLVVIHTSGSTGLPKPLIWTHESAIRHHDCAARDAPDADGVTSIEHLITGKRLMVTVPPFHGAGMAQYMLWTIPFGSIPIAPAAAGGIITAQGLADALAQTPADVAILVPSVVAELAQNPNLLDYCAARLGLILYIGGDLPQALGDRVAAKVPLHCWWGASECSIPHQLVLPGRGDWRYIRFHASVGAVFDRVADDTYELVMRRGGDDQEPPLPQVCFTVRGQQALREYRTKDLFQPHPTVPDAWCWRARADDIIVFLNGEKTNPISMEQHVVAHNPELGGALVVGAQRFQAALLIEPSVTGEAGGSSPSTTTAEQTALIERVWPSIQEANAAAPAHARVEKALILVTAPDRPLIRAAKGTIQRAASVGQYTAEIEALYANADLGPDGEGEPHAPLVASDAESIRTFVQESVSAVTSWPHEDADHRSSATFFERGMDSLMALQLTRVLRRGLHRPEIGLPTIYRNPTVSQLTAAILAAAEGGQQGDDDDRAMMDFLLDTYRGIIDQIPRPKTSSRADRHVGKKPITVILTGSTGTIGTHLLNTLLSRPGIGHIICLNRSEDGGKAAQQARFTTAGLDATELATRVTFLRADLSAPLLGLEPATYTDLRARAGLIIHNAWAVNFNLGLAAFRPHLAGLVNLLTLCAALDSPRGGLVFISSVSAAGGTSAAPEAIMRSLDAPHGNGYARSKLLGELLCDAAARRLGVPVTVARVGQVAGAVMQRPGDGGAEWNRAEWLPSLVISSLLRLGGCLPADLGPQFSAVDWLPVDVLSDVLIDVAMRRYESGLGPEAERATDQEGGGAEVFNLRNPRITNWEALLPAIIDAARRHLSPVQDYEVVSPSAWLVRLRDSESENKGNMEDNSSNPAIKLLDFYSNGMWANTDTTEQDATQSTQPMAINRALASSSTLRGVPAVSAEWMRKWVREWLKASKGS
ncbi:putative NRPS-like protein biosynthetic cluster [Diaporthe australafricana]|uniref:NRPS-like protein biosynthetic cluster n=1 Tax=Diaporthe australafricana TaxID=127596 RepID=A0ABR3X5W0_9PEZI